MFRGADTPEDVQRVAKLNASSIDYLGMYFFSEVFLGLYHDAHGNEVTTSRRALWCCGWICSVIVLFRFGSFAYSNVVVFVPIYSCM